MQRVDGLGLLVQVRENYVTLQETFTKTVSKLYQVNVCHFFVYAFICIVSLDCKCFKMAHTHLIYWCSLTISLSA